MDFIADGIKTTTSNGILFIFSVIYFGVLADTGLFDVIVGWLVKKAGNNVIAVTVVTALIANDRSSGRYYGCYRSHYDPGDVPGI